MIASTEPCTSPLMISGNSLRPAVLTCAIICSSEPRMPVWRAADLLALLARAIVGDFAGARLAVDDREAVAGVGRAGEAEHFDRHRGAGRRRPAAPVSETSARTRPHSAPATTMSPPRSVPRCTSTVATGPRPRSSLASITVPSAGRVRIGLEVEDFGLQRDGLEQLVEIELLGRRDLDVEHVAAERFDLHFVLQQLGAHALGLGVRPCRSC